LLLVFTSSLALSFIVSTAPVLAQTGSRAKSSDPPEEPGKAPEVTCAGVAVFSVGGGPEVHVLRRGMLDQRNPLAPSTNVPPATVLEVTIRGKLAAAYGPTFQEMRRAGPQHKFQRRYKRLPAKGTQSALPAPALGSTWGPRERISADDRKCHNSRPRRLAARTQMPSGAHHEWASEFRAFVLLTERPIPP
jgi:hypothetical protein